MAEILKEESFKIFRSELGKKGIEAPRQGGLRKAGRGRPFFQGCFSETILRFHPVFRDLAQKINQILSRTTEKVLLPVAL
jgi:hypothetical protein